MKKFLFILTISSLLMACRTDKEEQAYEPQDPTGSFGHINRQAEPALGQGKTVSLADVYSGTLPCEDCDKIEMTVRFNTDSTYFAEEIFHGKKEGEKTQRFYNFGLWSMVNDSTVWLRGGALGYSGQSALWFLKAVGKDSLKMLGQQIGDTTKGTSYFLTTSDKEFKPKTPFKMSGIYSMANDKAVFRECGTQKTFMVAKQEGYQKAADQYKNLKKAKEQKGVFTIAMVYLKAGKKGMAGSGEIAHSELVITEVLEFDPNTVCEPISVETPEPVERKSY